jgi:hypothetical protein
MAGQTISAYVDEKVAEKVEALSVREGVNKARFTGNALRFYTSLSGDARRALLAIEASGTPDERRWVTSEVMRLLLRAEFVIAQREMAAEMGDRLPKVSSEKELDAATATWTRSKRRAR